MKIFLASAFIILCFAASAAFSQEKAKTGDKQTETKTGNMSKIRERKPFEYDNESTFNANGVMTRGAGVRILENENAKTVQLADVLKKPADFAGKTVVVEGIIVRSCKMEGCWMELAPAKDAQSVRVTFKNHAFFIPLDSAGLNAKAKGVFSVKTLSKEQVEHLKTEDGAHFDNINADGTITEISFEASGVELSNPAN